MKYISLVYLLLLPITIQAERSAAASKEDLATFFSNKNYKEIESKVQNDSFLSGSEADTLKNLEDAMYGIAFKNKVLNADEKFNLFKLLKEKLKISLMRLKR